jgi:hypothetical protein
VDVRATMVAITWVVVILFLASFYQRTKQTGWLPTQGTIQDTRIVADHALQTKWGGEITWKAEYRVAYSVANREYTVWADSGIRGESEAEVQPLSSKSHPSCRVDYQKNKPDASVASCR